MGTFRVPLSSFAKRLPWTVEIGTIRVTRDSWQTSDICFMIRNRFNYFLSTLRYILRRFGVVFKGKKIITPRLRTTVMSASKFCHSLYLVLTNTCTVRLFSWSLDEYCFCWQLFNQFSINGKMKHAEGFKIQVELMSFYGLNCI